MNYEIEYYDKDGDYMEKNFSRKDSALKFMRENDITEFHMYQNGDVIYKEKPQEDYHYKIDYRLNNGKCGTMYVIGPDEVYMAMYYPEIDSIAISKDVTRKFKEMLNGKNK